MKKIIILLFLLTGCTKEAETPINIKEEPICKGSGFNYDYDSLNYALVWSDEFDVDGYPDMDKWKYEIGGSGWGNNELQYYTDQNATVENGILTIEAKKEEYENRNYTSSRLVSINDGNFKYGKIEVRAKLPYGRGTWPAIWMLPTVPRYGGWPRSGEIDIMEHVGYEMNKIHGTVHTSKYNHMEGTQQSGSKLLTDVSNEYHVYTIEWLPDKIIFYIDGDSYYQFLPGKYLNCASFREWPFDQEFNILLNLAVGGNWGGAQGVDETIWPQQFMIDYVRVYQDENITNIEVENNG